MFQHLTNRCLLSRGDEDVQNCEAREKHRDSEVEVGKFDDDEEYKQLSYLRAGEYRTRQATLSPVLINSKRRFEPDTVSPRHQTKPLLRLSLEVVAVV